MNATTETYVRARIDSAIKEEATSALKAMGLSMSDFIRISLTRVAHDKAIPFDIRVPNAITRAAMIEARQIVANRKARFTTPEELFHELEKETCSK